LKKEKLIYLLRLCYIVDTPFWRCSCPSWLQYVDPWTSPSIIRHNPLQSPTSWSVVSSADVDRLDSHYGSQFTR